VSVSVLLKHQTDKWRSVLEWVEDCNADGLAVQAQVSGRPIGALLGFELSRNPFWQVPTFKRLKALSQAERLAALRDPEVRARIVTEAPDEDDSPGSDLVRQWARMYPLGDPPNYEPSPDDSVAAAAARRGQTPEEFAYDQMLAQDGQAVLLMPTSGLIGGNLDTAGEVMRRPYTVPALGDGGAHLGILCDATYPTFMLQYWGRERRSGTGTIPVAELVRRLTQDPARAIGLCDRGVLAPGLRADINIIDFDNLRLGAPRLQRDLPAGGARVLQRATGYTATIVNGQVTYRDGVPTGALPGRLVRGPQSAQA
jgi:N-acyl-D-aspartate/D-glutamate deacylase